MPQAIAAIISGIALIAQSDDRSREQRLLAAWVPLALNWQFYSRLQVDRVH
ncbi:hypothetical protein [Nostoc sp.]|uniref:hypothetical protein n=1 Tax=Nostoc sp. TaxID=1180 RepID=UPI002FF91995